jgi:hypothetical protein
VLDLSPDYRVLLFTFIVALLAGMIFGLIPALQATRPDLVAVLKKDDDSSYGYRKSRLRNMLVVTQITLSLVLLICSGLFLKSLQKAQTLSPGFDTENLLLMTLNMNLHVRVRKFSTTNFWSGSRRCPASSPRALPRNSLATISRWLWSSRVTRRRPTRIC